MLSFLTLPWFSNPGPAEATKRDVRLEFLRIRGEHSRGDWLRAPRVRRRRRHGQPRARRSRGGGSTFSTSPPSKVASGVTAKDLQRTRSTQHELTLICREIDTLASLRHDCIVELKEYFVCSSGSRIHIVLELLPGGDLKDNLSWGERDFFSEAESRIIAKRVRRPSGIVL